MGDRALLELIDEALGLPKGTVHEDQQIADISEWDSLSTLSLVALLDDHYGLTLDLDSLANCKTLRDVVEVVARRR